MLKPFDGLSGRVKSITTIEYELREGLKAISEKTIALFNECGAEVHKAFIPSPDRKVDGYTCDNKYDSDGRIIASIEYDLDGALQSTTTYSYGENGMIDCECCKTSNCSYITEYRYNGEGRLIQKTCYKKNEKSTADTYLYFYDQERNETIVTLQSSLGYVYHYRYDSRDNLIEHGQEQSYKVELIRDGRCNVIERRKYSSSFPNGLSSAYSYLYDNHENWIERESFHKGNDKPYWITKRYIEYYE